MSEPKNGCGALATGGVAAVLASACCLGPLVLVAPGFSGCSLYHSEAADGLLCVATRGRRTHKNTKKAAMTTQVSTKGRR